MPFLLPAGAAAGGAAAGGAAAAGTAAGAAGAATAAGAASAGAAAGAFGAATAAGAAGAGVSLGTIGTYIGLGTSLLSGVSSARAQQAAGKATQSQLDLQAQGEKTQAAIESAAREKRLRAALAAQRAAFAGAGLDFTSGSPQLIQDQTAGQINKEQNLASLQSGLKVSQLNEQGKQASIASGIGATSTLLSSFGNTATKIGALQKATRPIT